MRRRRGTAIFTVLLVSTLLAVVFFVAAGLIGLQLGFLGHQGQRRSARHLAESAAALAIARLVENPNFAASVQVPGLSGDSFAGVNFDNSLNLPNSCNNLLQDQTSQGSLGAVLPPHSAQIVAAGRSGGQECRVEVILYIPRYPYDVACSGPIRCNGNLLVASVKGPAALAGGAGAVKEEDLEPGLLTSNAQDGGGEKSVRLQGSGVRVVGDLQSVGGIELDPAVDVSGEVRPNSSPAPLPALDLRDYDTAGKPGLLTVSSTGAPLTVGGFARHQGQLTLGGGLELQNGVLFVDGDLEVSGGIRGAGAVIVTGNTRVSGGGSLGTQNLAALLSGGTLSIEGTASQSASFQGLVYSGKALATKYADVAGLLLCNDPSGQSAMTLENSRLFRLPEASKIAFTVPPVSTPGSPPLAPSLSFSLPLGASVTFPDLPGTPIDHFDLNIAGSPFFDTDGYYGGTPGKWIWRPDDGMIGRWNLLRDPSYEIALFEGGVDQLGQTGNTQKSQIKACALYFFARYGMQPPAGLDAALDARLDEIEQQVKADVEARAQLLNDQGITPLPPTPGSPPGSTNPFDWSLDLSRFINQGELIRVLQWREF